ncbi:hypothetical protein C5167_027890 [Papaver somniferum]|nr:hypothetical protein C5167_027890 [Papaver somniferum]
MMLPLHFPGPKLEACFQRSTGVGWQSVYCLAFSSPQAVIRDAVSILLSHLHLLQRVVSERRLFQEKVAAAAFPRNLLDEKHMHVSFRNSFRFSEMNVWRAQQNGDIGNFSETGLERNNADDSNCSSVGSCGDSPSRLPFRSLTSPSKDSDANLGLLILAAAVHVNSKVTLVNSTADLVVSWPTCVDTTYDVNYFIAGAPQFVENNENGWSCHLKEICTKYAIVHMHKATATCFIIRGLQQGIAGILQKAEYRGLGQLCSIYLDCSTYCSTLQHILNRLCSARGRVSMQLRHWANFF